MDLAATLVIRTRPEVVSIDHVPVVVLHAHQELIAGDARIIDEHVDAPKRSLVASSSRSQSHASIDRRRWPARNRATDSISLAADSSRAASRPETTTEAPSSRQARAPMARPMPRVPPVTMAIRPPAPCSPSRGGAPARASAALSSDSGSLDGVSARPLDRALEQSREHAGRARLRARPWPLHARANAGSRSSATGLATWRTRNGLTSSAVVVSPRPRARHGPRGACAITCSSSAAEPVGGGFMSAE